MLKEQQTKKQLISLFKSDPDTMIKIEGLLAKGDFEKIDELRGFKKSPQKTPMTFEDTQNWLKRLKEEKQRRKELQQKQEAHKLEMILKQEEAYRQFIEDKEKKERQERLDRS